MAEYFHVRVTVRTDDGKSKSYQDGSNFRDKDAAIKAGEAAFKNTKDVIMVEVFQDGVAKATHHRFYEIWAVALLTGMRSGELYALKWSDIDFENRRITVSRSWCSKAGFGPTKTAKTRVVPISTALERLLKEMKLKAGPGAEFVLPHLSEWTSGEQAKVTRDFCQSIGITSVKFHDLRATFITQLRLKGVPLAQVMAVVGHTQLKTTNVYLRVVGSDLDGVTDRLGFSLPQERLAQVIGIHGA